MGDLEWKAHSHHDCERANACSHCLLERRTAGAFVHPLVPVECATRRSADGTRTPQTEDVEPGLACCGVLSGYEGDRGLPPRGFDRLGLLEGPPDRTGIRGWVG